MYFSLTLCVCIMCVPLWFVLCVVRCALCDLCVVQLALRVGCCLCVACFFVVVRC